MAAIAGSGSGGGNNKSVSSTTTIPIGGGSIEVGRGGKVIKDNGSSTKKSRTTAEIQARRKKTQQGLKNQEKKFWKDWKKKKKWYKEHGYDEYGRKIQSKKIVTDSGSSGKNGSKSKGSKKKSGSSKKAVVGVLTGGSVVLGIKGKRRYDPRLLLYGANKLDGFSSKYQVNKKTKLQKYIAALESYLTELGNVHKDATDTSCFKLSLSSLEDLNKDFNKLRTHVDKLSDKMRSIAKNIIKADSSKTYAQVNKASKKLKIKGSDVNQAMGALIGSLSAAEKKRLAKVIKKLKKLTSAEVSTNVVSRLKKTKAGKEFYKEYVKANTKTTKKSKSKVNTYKPEEYQSRSAWKKDLIEKYKNNGLSEEDAKKMATADMKLKEKLANKKITEEQYNKQIDEKLGELKLKTDDKSVKTDTIEEIKARNSEQNTSADSKASSGTDSSSSTSDSSSSSSTSNTTENTTPTSAASESSTPAPAPSSSNEGAAPAAAASTTGGAAAAAHETLPANNPEPQAASNFAESTGSEGAAETETPSTENQVDESATTDEGIDFSDNLDGETEGTSDTLTGLDGEDGESTTLDGVEDGTVSSKKSSSGTSPVIPVVAGVAAAGAAGVGAKIILDKRANSGNEENFSSEDWSDTSDYGLSSTDSDYYESTPADKNENLIDNDNTDSNYDYQANSIDEVNVEEKEKKDSEEKIASFNDNIAYDAISDADISATH